METAKTLIRTAVRTFYTNLKQILVIDALMIHSVLHIDDISILLSTQQKDIRRLIAPLKQARLLATHTRNEAKIGSVRSVSRDYYYIPLHPAIDAIKYRIDRLRKKVQEMYDVNEQRKDWRCPRCKAEYDEYDVLNFVVGLDGFECQRCGTALIETETADQPLANNEKLARLNTQLARFDTIMQAIDAQDIPENDFISAWGRKKDVPREKTGKTAGEYMTLKNNVVLQGRRGPEHTDASALNINLASGAEQDAAEEATKEQRRAELAKQNELPSWHTQGVKDIVNGDSVKAKNTSTALNGSLIKNGDLDEKKPDVTMDDEVAKYLAEMAREKEEAARMAAEEDAEESDGEEEDDLEDVVSTSGMGTPVVGIGTPSSSQPMPPTSNGCKRELDSDSGISSDANTPNVAATPLADVEDGREAKRVKFGGDGEKKEISDDEDEDDFEDAL